MDPGVDEFAVGGLKGRLVARVEPVSVGVTLFVADAVRVWSAVIGVDLLDPGVWWIARCLVREEYRGHGLGSYMLRRVQEHLQGLDGFVKIVVEPGGYNADPARQRAFYERQGFREEEPDGALIWTG